jgi:hypothetical protein
MERMRTIQLVVSVLVAAAAAGCSSGPPAPTFPEAIVFSRQTLNKAASWTRGSSSGIVYVPPTEKLPSASMQVGVIVSSEHATAAALHGWVREEMYRAGGLVLHDSGTADASCTAGGDVARTYMALEVCKTGVARAACAQADEVLDRGVWTSCINSPGCFQDVCDQRWLQRREALDALATVFLTKR